MRSLLLAAIRLSVLAPMAFSGEQGSPENCAGPTPEMVDCLMAQHAHWDNELTIAYKQALFAAEDA
jgi:uncharacterized protein YecT (DUF1311 family)